MHSRASRFYGSFTLSVNVNAAMSLSISLRLNCLDFLIKQGSHYKNGFQPQFTRYHASIDTDAPIQSLLLSVNYPLFSYDILNISVILVNF